MMMKTTPMSTELVTEKAPPKVTIDGASPALLSRMPMADVIDNGSLAESRTPDNPEKDNIHD